jgi:uncharacterized protein (TIGR02611 family)
MSTPPKVRRAGGGFKGFRSRIDGNPTMRSSYRIVVGTIGAIVLIVGIIAIPYPGPGWLIVFAGLGILASEFTWARRVLRYARIKYDAWTAWLGRQSMPARLLVLGLTGLFVVGTLYLLNAFYLLAGWVGLEQWTWLQSPFFG